MYEIHLNFGRVHEKGADRFKYSQKVFLNLVRIGYQIEGVS